MVVDSSGVSGTGDKVQYFGDYELLGEIARGAMGVVYKARQTSLNRVVAVKMILAGQLAGESEIKRFRAEAEAAANLQHPNIVAIHEVGEHQGRQYFSMDYVAGRNLAEVIRDRRPEAKEAAQWVRIMAEAIQYAHQRGILHRDLKPQNVLLDERGQPRITDFGLAKRLEQESGMTATGVVMGSPSYMPPEQASGRQGEVGPASDVYALGAILYQLLTDRPPFAAETPMATVLQVIHQEPESPRQWNPRLPVDLETICLKCLEKKPERRYATARALAEDLERFGNDEPVLARPASVWRKAWSWGRRHPWVLMLVLTAVLVVLMGAVFWLRTENDFLRFTSKHPEFAPTGRLDFDEFGRSIRASFLPIGIGIGFLYALAINRFMVGRRILTSRIAVSFARREVIDAFLGLVFGGILFITGVRLLRQSVEVHIWQQASVLMPLGAAFCLIYGGGVFGWVMLSQAFRDVPKSHGAPEPETLLAGFAELRRGDLREFWRKAMPGAFEHAADNTAWSFTPVRVGLAVLMLGGAIGISGWSGMEYRNLVVAGWILGAMLTSVVWADHQTLQQILASKMKTFLWTSVMGCQFLFLVFVIRMASDQLAALFLPAGIGAVLGVSSVLPLMRWKTSPPQSVKETRLTKRSE